MSLSVETNVEYLWEMESQELPCEHSEHEINKMLHSGPAVAYLKINHYCPSGIGRGMGAIYRGCAVWTSAVQERADKTWGCVLCGASFRRGIEFVEFVGWI